MVPKDTFSKSNRFSADRKTKLPIITAKIADSLIYLTFHFDEELVHLVRQIPGRWWHEEQKVWTIPNGTEVTQELTAHFKGVAKVKIVYRQRPSDSSGGGHASSRERKIPHHLVPEDFIALLKKKRYSRNTIRNYSAHLASFIGFTGKKTDAINEKDISDYLLHCSNEDRYSTAYQRLAIHAIRFYYSHFRKIQLDSDTLPWPKGEKRLPVVFSSEEVTRMLAPIQNNKHRCIMWVIYSGGLRLSEVINLKVNDIDFNRMQIHIRKSKGKKDRYTILSEKTATLLKEYLNMYSPDEWLFTGQKGGKYSTKSVQMIFKKALSTAGVTKHATVHTLRHSFATHLLENGVDLRYIQELLGHTNPKTTEIYTHVTRASLRNIKSPIDLLPL